MQVGLNLWRVLFPDNTDRQSQASGSAKAVGDSIKSPLPSLLESLVATEESDSSSPNTLWTQIASRPASPAEILGRYDLTDITPREFSQLLDELHQAGLLTDEQFRELNEIRKDLASADVLPQEKIDLLDFYRQLLDQAKTADGADNDAGNLQRIADWQRRLGWLEKLASAQAEIAAISESPESLALDTWA